MTNALYLRLSLADGDLGKDGKDESNSIENQRRLLEDYLKDHKELSGEIVEYIDDGYSGTNFDRPAFRRMIEDSKKRKIQTLLIKDLSRLGRDYIGVGDYLDQIFPVLGVRVIAVNSCYDSNQYLGKTLGLDMTVSNLVNTLYSRDLSRKIKSALVSKWKQGKNTCGNPPFGFVRCESAKGGWAVDPEASDVVRKIFDKALEGWDTKMITEYLNERKILTPGQYKRMKGRYSGHTKTNESEVLWNTAMVLSILKRYEYCGAFVHNKRTTIQVGSNMVRNVPEHERIVTDDAHEAIITKDEYYQAQSVLHKSGIRRHYRGPVSYTLKGKIRCGTCGLALAYKAAMYDPFFYCAHTQMTGEASKCCKDYYSEREIEGAVLTALNRQLTIVRSLCCRMEEERRNNPSDLSKRIRKLEKQIEIKREERIRYYEAYAEGQIGKEEYIKKKDCLSDEIKKLEQEDQELSAVMSAETEAYENINEIYRMAEATMTGDKLTEEMVDHFVETVYVFDREHVEVRFKFDDMLREHLDKFGGVT